MALYRCVLCHQEQHADARDYVVAQRQITRTPEGVTNRALGPLLLVRVSAISNAWVHMQCALWSGEVRSSVLCNKISTPSHPMSELL